MTDKHDDMPALLAKPVKTLLGPLKVYTAEQMQAAYSAGQRAAALRAAQVWQPIETAPREECYRDGQNIYGEYILAWHPGSLAAYRCRWWFRDDTGACNFIADGGYVVSPPVWMPLPPPPILRDAGIEKEQG